LPFTRINFKAKCDIINYSQLSCHLYYFTIYIQASPAKLSELVQLKLDMGVFEWINLL